MHTSQIAKQDSQSEARVQQTNSQQDQTRPTTSDKVHYVKFTRCAAATGGPTATDPHTCPGRVEKRIILTPPIF